ncbi:hypothetical protein JXA84_08380 [candidate division WOR-3 bacterium]|nr:hypothetical protein [candidate division WOR-3 bacterium]
MSLSQSEKKFLKQVSDYKRQKRYDEAIVICRKLLEMNEDPEIHRQLGDLLERINKNDDAKEHFLKSAKLYEETEMLREALGIYTRLSRLMKGKEDELGWDKAQLYIKQNMIAEAIKELTSYGFLKFEQNDIHEACKSFDKIIELDPMNMKIRAKYSNLLEQESQFQKAIDNFEFMKTYFEKENEIQTAKDIEKKIASIKSKINTVFSGKPKETKDEYGEPTGDFGFMLGEFITEEKTEKKGAEETEIASNITQSYYEDFPVSEKDRKQSESSYVEIKLEDSQLAPLPSLSKIGEGSETISLGGPEQQPKPEIELDISDLKIDRELSVEDIFETKKTASPTSQKTSGVGKKLSKQKEVSKTPDEELFEFLDEEKREYAEITEKTEDLISGLDLDELIKEMKEVKPADSVFVQNVQQRIEVNEKVKKREDTIEMSSLDQSLSIDSLLDGGVDSWSNLAAELAKEMLDNKSAGEIKETQNKMLTSTWEEFEEQAELLLSVGEVEEAVDYLYQAADAYYDENQFDKAWALYEKIVDLRPFELRPRQKMVQIALKSENAGKALLAYISLYDCQKLRGAFIDAEETMKKLRKLAPEDPAVISRDVMKPIGPQTQNQSIELSDLLEYEHHKKVPQNDNVGTLIDEFKEEVYQSISSSERENFDAHYDLGITFKEMGLIEEAMEEFNIAMKSKKSYVKSVEMMANCLLELEKKSVAIKQLEEVIARDEFNENELVGIRYLLGNLYEESGEDEKAKHHYFQVMKVYPDFSDIKDRIKKYM